MDVTGYKNSRTLATVDHSGYTFRIVRARFGGKPWRKYVALVLGDTLVSDPRALALSEGCYTDADIAARVFRDLLIKHFPPGSRALEARLHELGAID